MKYKRAVYIPRKSDIYVARCKLIFVQYRLIKPRVLTNAKCDRRPISQIKGNELGAVNFIFSDEWVETL